MALTDNLVSVWCENADPVTDLHGSNDLTNNNSVSTATGKVGTAGDFEKGSSQYLSITDAAQTGLDITGDMSLNMWAQFEDLGADGTAFRLVTKWQSDRSYNLYWYNTTTDILVLELTDSSATESTSSVSWTPSTATWYMITMTYTASAGEVRFYINGSQQGSTQTGAVTNIANDTAEFQIGANATADSFYFDGLLNQVAIWSKVLNTTEISDLYNSGSGLAYTSWAGGAATPLFNHSTLLTLGVG
jgi:hypothetical protein